LRRELHVARKKSLRRFLPSGFATLNSFFVQPTRWAHALSTEFSSTSPAKNAPLFIESGFFTKNEATSPAVLPVEVTNKKSKS
jgi:hypothetical protein